MSGLINKLDSQESIFFDRELESVKSQSYDVKFPRLQFAEGSIVPISTEAGEGVQSITYETYEEMGIAKIISDYASDLPRADVKGKETTVPVRDLASSFGYSIREIKAARRTGKPLEARKANAARRAVMQQLDAIALSGDSDSGLSGFLSHPNISEVTLAADGATSQTTFEDKQLSPDKIIRDMNSLVSHIVDTTKGVEAPDTLLMPHAQYELIANTPRSSTSDTTILEWFLRNTPHIKSVVPVAKLKGAGTGGTDVMVAYENNPANLTLEIPDPFQILAPEQRGLEYVVPALLSTAGVVVYYPLSVAKAEGV
jgi:hypothetical protein